MLNCLRSSLLIVSTLVFGASLACPCRAGTGTAYLGRDVLWRTREGLVFHLHDEQGTGFELTFTVRDMNVYMQGPRAVFFMVVGPEDQVLVKRYVPDDGIVSGNAQYHDGMHDVYMDFRYRQWHFRHSPGRYPPGKQRAPALEHPERLPARTITFSIPAAGKGLYRANVIASWDHWISIASSRPMPTGVHPGSGPLYVHGDRFAEAYVYAPANVQDMGITVSEEIEPYNWTLRLEDLAGKALAKTTPRTFMSYLVHKDAKGDAVYRLRVKGKTTGACLYFGGFPPVLCPDADTARTIHGGIQLDAKGRSTCHPHQRVLNAWADALKPADLNVDVPPAKTDKRLAPSPRVTVSLGDVPKLLAEQDLDPASPTYGRCNARALAAAAGTQDPANPYYGNAALVRRVLLGELANLRGLSAFFWYDGRDGPTTFDVHPDKLFSVAMRSNWYPMQDATNVYAASAMKGLLDKVLPTRVVGAWKQSLRLWAYARAVAHQGECSNQWCEVLAGVARAYRFTDDPFIRTILDNRIGVLTTPGGLGRAAPDPTPYSTKSAVKYTFSADNGLIGDGCLSDGLGFDAEYCLEQVLYIRDVWEVTRDPRFFRWWRPYFSLKTHLTLPKWGKHTANCFAGTVSPTDVNHRTRYYTHKCAVPVDAVDRIPFADLWSPTKGVAPKRPWPCLEPGTFTRVVDNKYFFIRTPAYYSIAYGGPANYDWMSFCRATVKDGSAELVGYTGMHYGGLGRKSTKPGGISAVFVPGCGPTLFCFNHNVMFTNAVWGRRRTPICPKWEPGHVDPTIVTSAYAHPYTTFDRGARVYRKIEQLTYAPLQVSRTIHFKDDRICVRLEVLATDDLDLVELYECVPYFVDRRTLTLFGADLSKGKPFDVPTPLTTPGKWPKGQTPDAKLLGWPNDLPSVTFRAMDIAAKGGAGSTVIFDKAYTFKQTQPLRYRAVAAAVGAFNLSLPATMKAGQIHTVRYVIFSHAKAVTPARIGKVAAEEFRGD